MDITSVEYCANCYQSVDIYKRVHRAFSCAKCGALAVECGVCAEKCAELGLAGTNDCAQCNIQDEVSR